MAHKQKKHHPREVDQDKTEKIIILTQKMLKNSIINLLRVERKMTIIKRKMQVKGVCWVKIDFTWNENVYIMDITAN